MISISPQSHTVQKWQEFSVFPEKQREYRKQSDYGGQIKSILGKTAKTTKKIELWGEYVENNYRSRDCGPLRDAIV